MGDGQLVDSMIRDGLWDAFNDCHMGITAENICTESHLSREELDAFALESQRRAVHAIEAGTFRDEIVPVEVPGRKGSTFFEQDQQPRAETTAEALAKLRPAFKKDGMVTAGNSSGLNDGGAAVVVMSRTKAEELGLRPLATIRSYASAGVDPRIMGMGPVPSSRRALEKAGLSVADLDVVEANEAFAAQSVAVGKELVSIAQLTSTVAHCLGHPIEPAGRGWSPCSMKCSDAMRTTGWRPCIGAVRACRDCRALIVWQIKQPSTLLDESLWRSHTRIRPRLTPRDGAPAGRG
jgi:acetyl-CoA C-acetyltransferase